MAKLNYEAACRAMIKAGDFTTFSDILTIAPVTAFTKCLGLTHAEFRDKMHQGFTFTERQIGKMAKVLDVDVTQMKKLVEADRELYKKDHNPRSNI